MRCIRKRTIFLLQNLLFIFCCIVGSVESTEATVKDKPSEFAATATPDLIALFSLAQELSIGYVDLKEQLEDLQDIKETKTFFYELKNNLNTLSLRLDEFKKSKTTSYGQLIDIRLKLKLIRLSLHKKMKPINEMLNDVTSLENDWLEKQKNWMTWKKSFNEEAPSETVQSLMKRSEELTSEALLSISKKLEFIIEDKLLGTELDFRSYSLLADVEGAISKRSALFRFGEHPMMFTPAYLSQFNSNMWSGLIHGIGIFYSADSSFWHLLLMIIGWSVFARLLVVFIPVGRKRWLIYWIIFTMVLMNFIGIIRLPMPLYRLFILGIASFGGVLFWYNARQEKGEEGSFLLTIVLYSFSVILFVIALLDVIGFSDFSGLVFTSMIEMVCIVLVARFLLFIAKEGVDWIVNCSPLRDHPLLISHGSHLISKSLSLIYLIIGVFIIVSIFISWHVFDTPMEAIEGICSFGISIGNFKITIGIVIGIGVILYGAFLASWIIQILLTENIFPMMSVPQDVGQSMARLIHYLIVIVGFLMVLLTLGFSLTNLTIIAGSLGIGVGLGLQEIVKNFAAGILVLFERPIRVGDVIAFEGGPCTVKEIGLRSTLVKTKNETEIVIPNNDLITNPLTNWTLSQRRMRLKFPVGVGYDSDVAQVMKIMKECAEGNGRVLKVPPPQVIFMDFGESSLDFEMRVWIHDIKNRRVVQTEINQELEERFRSANIKIPYNQLDIHIQNEKSSP
jgi:small-conductance mechanosensitive channel